MASEQKIAAQGRKRRERVVRHFRIDDELSGAELEAYLGVLREPRTTVDLAWGWLGARGKTFSRSAVARHRRWYLIELREGRRQVEMAEGFAGLARDKGMAAISQAAVLRVEQLLCDGLFDEEREPMTVKELAGLARAILDAVKARNAVVEWSGGGVVESEKGVGSEGVGGDGVKRSEEERRERAVRRVREALGGGGAVG